MRCSGAKDAVIESVGFGTSSARISYVRTVEDKGVGKEEEEANWGRGKFGRPSVHAASTDQVGGLR